MKDPAPKHADTLGDNLSPVRDTPAQQGAPSDVNEHIAMLAKQMAALTALVTATVQHQAVATGVKFVSPIEAEPLPDTPEAPEQPRVWIVLEDNDEIPPGGQFIQVDGVPYLLRSGERALVPVGLVDVLDHAIKSVPVCDENRNIVAYKDRLRFSYRVVRDRDLPAHEREEVVPPAHVAME